MTGPKDLGCADVAELMTAAMGKKVFYVNISSNEEAEEDMAAFHGRDEWYNTTKLEMFEGQAKVTCDHPYSATITTLTHTYFRAGTSLYHMM